MLGDTKTLGVCMERFRGRLARTTAQRLARNWAVLHRISGTDRAEPPGRDLARGFAVELFGAVFLGPVVHALFTGERPTGRAWALAALGLAITLLAGVWRGRRARQRSGRRVG